jgi:hypothetical protein
MVEQMVLISSASLLANSGSSSMAAAACFAFAVLLSECAATTAARGAHSQHVLAHSARCFWIFVNAQNQ